MPVPRLAMALALAAATLVAGCAARGDVDPFAYMKKPLYNGAFDLADVAGGNVTHQFWVTDGSIAEIHARLSVEAAAGSARMILRDPSGAVAIDTAVDVDKRLALDLGAWSITIEASPDARGDAAALITRAGSVR